MASENFWSNPILEPKRQMRFLLNINGIPQWVVKKVNKPEFTVGDVEHRYLNHTFHYPAGLKWSPVSCTLVDPVTPDASRTMMDILNRSGYRFPLNPTDTTTLSKAGAVLSLGRVVIAQIGPEKGEVIEEWELVNAWISKVNFGSLDYSSDEMTEIEIEFVYDFAMMRKSGPPVKL